PFNLDGRPPQREGKTVADAAPKLLDRCYTIVKENRGDLLEIVRATYANDLAVMERLRSRAGETGSRAARRRLLYRFGHRGGRALNGGADDLIPFACLSLKPFRRN
ncbi:MAG: hypothetical protein ACREH8_13690, partial [Opitutaceae bacterium]